ncbi:MAG: DUF4114 domain-containing protein, partial [Alphaproteobacteria bacterium]|nr:DUF4114 domain-containing protein [Alphaproteobacteria bacterium]
DVAADGTIHDVRVLLADARTAPMGQTLDLGTPAAGDRIGLFLISDGFDTYGALPNDLSFVKPGSGNVANVGDAALPVLFSASQGALVATSVFHSFAASLNPGGATQVVTGLAAGSQDLQMAFDDQPIGRSDRDFNDVVFAIHARQVVS